MSYLSSFAKRRPLFALLLIATMSATLLVTAGQLRAMGEGKPGGSWPEEWPKELESLRKQSWTWRGGLVGNTRYDIPFADRKDFESAWPHILRLTSKVAPLKIARGPRIHTKQLQSAGVLIYAPLKGHSKGPYSAYRITLVVDGDIVDLNRIRLPAETSIDDIRFQAKKAAVAVGDQSRAKSK